ncbi:metal dependent phosphohydrolase, HD region [Streptococcus pneumoniae]|nr:metal dependent phosphohydrolase, HD region [Streptococcus pneumoniae]
MIDIALAIAKKAHAGQVDKAGVDYIQASSLCGQSSQH